MEIIGIDGGGTHTRVRLQKDTGEQVREENFGPFNLSATGEVAFRERVGEILSAFPEMRTASAVCIGAAGITGGNMERILREMLTQSGFSGRLRLCGDHEIALAGAMPGPGIALIAGTGSICCGRDSQGRFCRCGGYGHILDDGGSAYAVGKAALAETIRFLDGRSGARVLSEAVLSALRAAEPADIVRFVYHKPAEKAEIASLARTVLQCAGNGDPDAMEILRQQARELAQLVDAICRKMEVSSPKLALLGGMLIRGGIYPELVKEAVGNRAEVCTPAHDPLWGACALAKAELE